MAGRRRPMAACQSNTIQHDMSMHIIIQAGAVPWRRAKLVVIGSGDSGKSCTIRALCDQPFEDTRSTIGAATSVHELDYRQVSSGGEEGASAFQDYRHAAVEQVSLYHNMP